MKDLQDAGVPNPEHLDNEIMRTTYHLPKTVRIRIALLVLVQACTLADNMGPVYCLLWACLRHVDPEVLANNPNEPVEDLEKYLFQFIIKMGILLGRRPDLCKFALSVMRKHSAKDPVDAVLIHELHESLPNPEDVVTAAALKHIQRLVVTRGWECGWWERLCEPWAALRCLLVDYIPVLQEQLRIACQLQAQLHDLDQLDPGMGDTVSSLQLRALFQKAELNVRHLEARHARCGQQLQRLLQKHVIRHLA